MVRISSAVAAGVVTWMVMVSLINFVPRLSWPAYAAAELSYGFTLPMMIMRLMMSAACSLLSGYVAGWIERGDKAGWIAGLTLLLLFLPDHIGLWGRFPAWYHLIFLASLPLLGWAGSRLRKGLAA
jgi:hypothetical protein